MRKQNLLSVIVTVYNAEKYLEKCIQSILNQTYQEIEILLINDGSADSSGRICDMYAEKDARVRVYHQNNAGVVLARKVGVELATGEAITFVDSDDWIKENMYQNMMEYYLNNDVQLVTSGLIINDEHGNYVNEELDILESSLYESVQNSEQIIANMIWSDELGRRSITPSVCNKIFSRELLLKVIGDIDSEITLGEDAAIVYPYIAMAKSVIVLNRSWYHYIFRIDSMVRKSEYDSFVKVYKLKTFLMERFEQIGILNQMLYPIEQYCRVFLRSIVYSIYGMEMDVIQYMFPYELLPKGSKVIIYGAGKVGRSYWNCLKMGQYADVVAWVDRRHGELVNGRLIEKPESLIDRRFDYIVIAIENEEKAEEVKKYLTDNSINSDIVIWCKPRRV